MLKTIDEELVPFWPETTQWTKEELQFTGCMCRTTGSWRYEKPRTVKRNSIESEAIRMLENLQENHGLKMCVIEATSVSPYSINQTVLNRTKVK